jgi:hypothetical protein
LRRDGLALARLAGKGVYEEITGSIFRWGFIERGEFLDRGAKFRLFAIDKYDIIARGVGQFRLSAGGLEGRKRIARRG